MSRVNVYGTMSGDKRSVSVGGRSANNRIESTIDFDHAGGTGRLRCGVGVGGNTLASQRRRSVENGGGDDRVARVDVILPHPSAGVEVCVRLEGIPDDVYRRLDQLAALGPVFRQWVLDSEQEIPMFGLANTIRQTTCERAMEVLAPYQDVSLPFGLSLGRPAHHVAGLAVEAAWALWRETYGSGQTALAKTGGSNL